MADERTNIEAFGGAQANGSGVACTEGDDGVFEVELVDVEKLIIIVEIVKWQFAVVKKLGIIMQLVKVQFVISEKQIILARVVEMQFVIV